MRVAVEIFTQRRRIGSTLESTILSTGDMLSSMVPASRFQRFGASLVICVLGLMICQVSYYQYWKKQQQARLYEFSTKANSALVPVDCGDTRGKINIDFVRASAPSVFGHSRAKPSHVDACWYPIEAYLNLFPDLDASRPHAIINHQYEVLNLKQSSFEPTHTPNWPLIGIPIGMFVIVVGVGSLFARPATDANVGVQNDAMSDAKIDASRLRTELARLRDRLGN
jgi:hypothetical protein